MKNSEMLKFVLDNLKTKKMCNHVVKKLPFLIRYVPQQMCDEAILENGGTLNSIPDYYTIQEMCNKAVDNYPHALKFVPEFFKAQKCVIRLFRHILLQ